MLCTRVWCRCTHTGMFLTQSTVRQVCLPPRSLIRPMCRGSGQSCQCPGPQRAPAWPCSSWRPTWALSTSCSQSWPCSRTRWGPWTLPASARRSGCRIFPPRGSVRAHSLPDSPSPSYIQTWPCYVRTCSGNESMKCTCRTTSDFWI